MLAEAKPKRSSTQRLTASCSGPSGLRNSNPPSNAPTYEHFVRSLISMASGSRSLAPWSRISLHRPRKIPLACHEAFGIGFDPLLDPSQRSQLSGHRHAGLERHRTAVADRQFLGRKLT